MAWGLYFVSRASMFAWSKVLPCSIGWNCFGLESRLIGHSLVPSPPAITMNFIYFCLIDNFKVDKKDRHYLDSPFLLIPVLLPLINSPACAKSSATHLDHRPRQQRSEVETDFLYLGHCLPLVALPLVLVASVLAAAFELQPT